MTATSFACGDSIVGGGTNWAGTDADADDGGGNWAGDGGGNWAGDGGGNWDDDGGGNWTGDGGGNWDDGGGNWNDESSELRTTAPLSRGDSIAESSLSSD